MKPFIQEIREGFLEQKNRQTESELETASLLVEMEYLACLAELSMEV